MPDIARRRGGRAAASNGSPGMQKSSPGRRC